MSRFNSKKTSFGVSFSVKYCNELGIDWRETLLATVDDLGVKRLRLMSYWDEIQSSKASLDFKELDWQIKQCESRGVEVTLCVGLRQPRWPECHVPKWAQKLSDAELTRAIMEFNETIVNRYRDSNVIQSWQLENEALNRGIGTCTNFSRRRLRAEYKQLKMLDPTRPIIMSTSNSIGIPIRNPRPDVVGFSLYKSQYDYKKDRYTSSKIPAWLYAFRSWVIRHLLRKKVIIHELQCEPWGPRATVDMSAAEQSKSMNLDLLRASVEFAKRTGIPYIDMWGTEWWYYRKTVFNDDKPYEFIKSLVKNV